MNYQPEFCILGAGLAGLSLADTLSEHDINCMVLEKGVPGSGASGTPGALVNPATGRKGKKSWMAEPCYETIAETLEKVQAHSNIEFYRNNGLLRPALLKKMARKMKEQHEGTTWPDGWCQWKTEDEIKEMHPSINCIEGGLWLPIGLTVDVGKYMKEYASYLENKGVTILSRSRPQHLYYHQKWILELENQTVSANHLVFATGRYTTESSYWDWLPIHLIKGQVAKFKKSTGSLPFSHSISSLGYIARLDEEDTLIQGSTYEHDFEHLNPDHEGEEYLRKRMRRTLPHLETVSELVEQWAGGRTSTPNYKPILGQHPEHKNLHIFTGLGSKGLLYSKFLSDHYAEHIIKQKPLYPEIAITRFVD